MIKFLSESLRELRHVVWPTYTETRKYFFIVLTILVLFGTYLFVSSTLFSKIIFSIRDMLSSNEPNIIQTLDSDSGVNIIETPNVDGDASIDVEIDNGEDLNVTENSEALETSDAE